MPAGKLVRARPETCTFSDKITYARRGDSVALCLPAELAQRIHAIAGFQVDLTIEGGKVVLTPLASPTCTLDELVAGITSENRHGEICAHHGETPAMNSGACGWPLARLGGGETASPAFLGAQKGAKARSRLPVAASNVPRVSNGQLFGLVPVAVAQKRGWARSTLDQNAQWAAVVGRLTRKPDNGWMFGRTQMDGNDGNPAA
jgi:antitoxin MazE